MQEPPRPTTGRLAAAGQQITRALSGLWALPGDLRTSLAQLSLVLAGTPVLLLAVLAWAPLDRLWENPREQSSGVVFTQPLPPVVPTPARQLTHALRQQAAERAAAPEVTAAIQASLLDTQATADPSESAHELQAALSPTAGSSVLPPRVLEPPPLPRVQRFHPPSAVLRPGWTHRLSFPGPTGRRPPPTPELPASKPPDGRLLPLQSAAILPADLPFAVGLHLGRQTRQDIAQVEAAFDMPEGLLQALALVESGTTVGGEKHPWPWSLNSNGHGWRFASRQDALAALDRLLLAGFSSVDLGALQVNLYWHGEDVSEFAHGLDPRENAEIAARYLNELHRQHGRWEDAVRHYHSYNPAHQQRYLCRVRAELARLGQNPGALFVKTICG